MSIQDLMTSISNSTPNHFHIWFGEEQKIADIYLDKLSELNYKQVYLDTVSQAYSQSMRKSLDKSNKVYVVIDDESFKTAETKWDEVIKYFNKSNNILLLRYNKLNKTTKFYNHNKKYCTQFDKMSRDILVKYVKKELPTFTTDNATKLCELCLDDYGRILLECDKISRYSTLFKCIDNDAFKLLLKDNAIYSEIGDITFSLTNSVLYGDSAKSIYYLDLAKQRGESSLVILSILYKGFKNLLAYEMLGKDKSNATARTGMSGWQIKQCIDLRGGYNLKELLRNMLICQQIESDIKTGKIDEKLALDYTIICCLH